LRVLAQKRRIPFAIRAYVQCEKEVRDADENLALEDRNDLLRVSALLFRDVFTLVERDIHNCNITGKHGPGQTADRRLGNQKFYLDEWSARLEAVFPYGSEAVPSPRFVNPIVDTDGLDANLYDRVNILELGEERPVKVTLVPKTPGKPRIISIEPTCTMFMQQGLGEKFCEYLETDKTVSGMIGFTSQLPNQEFAREGSHLGILATLDLKEASDRVSNRHVETMLQRFPTLKGAVDAVRSRRAVLPDGSIIDLVKFASMGSALTFPVEAMVFLTLVFVGMERELNRQFTRKDIKSFASQVRVYGDDIIVPVTFVSSVISVLECFGFRVNAGKSFWNGKFRESCGKEYFDGVDVSITRFRREIPASLTDRSVNGGSNWASKIISTVSLRNQLYSAGLWQSAMCLDGYLAPLLKHYYPVLNLDCSSVAFTGKPGNGSPLLGRQSFFGYEAEWADDDLQIPLVKGWTVRAKNPMNGIDGPFALVKWFVKRGDMPFADVDHLERSGRPKSVSIKLGWKPPY